MGALGHGLKLPLRAIADAIAEEDERRGAESRTLLCVDAGGTGIVWGRPEAWARGRARLRRRGRALARSRLATSSSRAATSGSSGRVSPTIPSFTDPASFGAWLEGGPSRAATAAAFTPGGFHAFEHRWALAQALDFQRTIGKRRVRERTHALARRLKAGLADLPGIVLHTPMAETLSAGLVCFEVGSRPPEEIVERLQREHGIVASVTPYASRYVRFGTSIVNSEDEVDAALAALRGLA